MRVGCMLIAAALGTAACKDAKAPDAATAPDAGVVTPDQAELFSIEQLPRFELTIDQAGQNGLGADPKTYVRANFRYGTEVLTDVGVRLKGGSTLTRLFEKPSFKIKFNKFIKGQRFAGLEALTLNNLWSDPTMVREYLSYGVFRDVGLVAPRVGYAEVSLNGQHYGLYCNVETIDDPFLKRNFADPNGNLYEANYFTDLDKLTKFDQDEGKDHSRQDLTELGLAASEGRLFSVVDATRLLRFLAAEVLLGQYDGYTALHNYYLYRDPSTKLWTWIPASMDVSFERELDPYWGKGLARKICFEDPKCRAQYTQTARELVSHVRPAELRSRLEAVRKLIEPAWRRDPRRPYTDDDIERAQAQLRAWIEARPAKFGAALDAPDMR